MFILTMFYNLHKYFLYELPLFLGSEHSSRQTQQSEDLEQYKMYMFYFKNKSLTTGASRKLHKHRRWLEAGNFRFRKKKQCTIRVAKTKALIRDAVTAMLICEFVFEYAKCLFSHDVASL